MSIQPSPRVGLFYTCLVDLYRPSVGFACIQLLEQAGCQVDVPAGQTCCGQPAFNSGARQQAQQLARRVIEQFQSHDHVVCPSGSCASLLKHHYPDLFQDDPEWQERARQLAARSYELSEFLQGVIGFRPARQTLLGQVTYHDSCSGLRELGIHAQPRALLREAGIDLEEMQDAQVCCGFGGTFCAKYKPISTRMSRHKAEQIEASGAATLLGGDLGCLLTIGSHLSRRGSPVKVMHIAEALAGAAPEENP